MSFGPHAIAHGDVLAVLKELPDNEFDALLCDPPYGFSFMGKKWDYDVPSVDVWRECLRVLKPGAPLVSFGGTRTYHRITCAIEDAGFEIRDSIAAWIYGSGFPKSLDVSKAIDKAAGAAREVIGSRTLTGNAAVPLKEKGGTFGVQCLPKKGACQHCGANTPYTDWTICEACLALGRTSTPRSVDVPITAPATPLAQQWAGYGTALKPAWEPAILARKPIESTVAANVAKWGCGALAIDACRIGYASEADRAQAIVPQPNTKTKRPGVHDGASCSRNGEMFDPGAGRWPANVIMDEDAGAALDAAVGVLKSPKSYKRNVVGHSSPNPMERDGGRKDTRDAVENYGDSGGPSRFFYCAKVSTREREYGCGELALKSSSEIHGREQDSPGVLNPRAGAQGRGGARNHHPTLKPIALTRWLARLIMPPTSGAQLLVPFSGAGSEMIGALTAGWPAVFGIEGEADYIEIAHARIAAWSKGTP